MSLQLGWQRTVVLTGFETVKEALVDQAEDFTGRAPVPFLHRATRGFGKPNQSLQTQNQSDPPLCPGLGEF